MAIDSHAHLTFDVFKGDLEDVISRAKNSGVRAIICVSVDARDFLEALRISEGYTNYVYPTLGLAPQMADEIKFEEFLDALERWKGKYVAIGECGLDYYWRTNSDEVKFMIKSFSRIAEIARNDDIPLIVHARSAHGKNAYREIVRILRNLGVERAVFHAFLGRKGDAREITRMGWLVSIPTIYIRRPDLWEIIKATSLECMLVETDSPYLPPSKGERNEPANVIRVLELISKVKEMDAEEVSEIILSNTCGFFGIKV